MLGSQQLLSRFPATKHTGVEIDGTMWKVAQLLEEHVHDPRAKGTCAASGELRFPKKVVTVAVLISDAPRCDPTFCFLLWNVLDTFGTRAALETIDVVVKADVLAQYPFSSIRFIEVRCPGDDVGVYASVECSEACV
jgi:hypothetical protein